MPLIGRIRDVYDTLPASERALADILLEFPGDITVYSASELAERAQVSNAAVSRFIKRLKFEDYRDARQMVRRAQASGQPIYLNNSLVQPPSRARSIEQHLERDQSNLLATFQALDRKQLAAAVRALVKAERIWTLGFRNSYFFAGYLRRQLNQSRPDVTLLPQPGQIVMEDLAAAGRKDLVAIVGMRRRVVQLETVMSYLRTRKVPVLYITDHRAVKTAELATWTFRCQSRGVSLFDSYVSVISLLNFLCTELAAETADAGRRRLALIEDGMAACREIHPGN